MAIKIYTCGKMSNLSFDEQMEWRINFQLCMQSITDTPITYIHPPLYYNYEHTNHKTEAEIKVWELNQIRSSDIVIVNLNDINKSVGSHFELGFIDAINMFGNKHIYVIGVGDTSHVHPWIELNLFRHEPDIASACQYIKDYLLV